MRAFTVMAAVYALRAPAPSGDEPAREHVRHPGDGRVAAAAAGPLSVRSRSCVSDGGHVTTARPRILICANAKARDNYVVGPAAERLSVLADRSFLLSEGAAAPAGTGWQWGGPSIDPGDRVRLKAALGDIDALIVCHGAPLIDDEILATAPRLRLIGELEGDRFANRIDVEAAAARGIRVVDTTHGSSPPVAEWALGLILVGLRNAGAHFRRLVAGEFYRIGADRGSDPGWRMSELTGRRVGLIGLGHIGRRLVELLAPFRCDIAVHDPYVPKEVALASHVELTSLEDVMSREVVVCCAPITPRTHRMIGAPQLALLRPDSVFVNVSRGAIVDPDALIARAKQDDGVRFALDVFDPEPIPVESEIRRLPNIFLSPHIASLSQECGPRFFAFMVDELERFFGGRETMFDITPHVLANRRGLPPT
ncbi:MAG: hypothetical protein EPO26_07290 [Chloroflexota bacterium]|nr:MAG: hypothetical protein EPO26_07290 [Chloroflexota bacterium]